MSGWSDDQKFRWLDVWMARWSNVSMATNPDGQESGWQDDQMSGWPDYQMFGWLDVWMTKCLYDQMTKCPYGQKSRNLGYKYKSWNIGVALATGPLNPSKDPPCLVEIHSTLINIWYAGWSFPMKRMPLLNQELWSPLVKFIIYAWYHLPMHLSIYSCILISFNS